MALQGKRKGTKRELLVEAILIGMGYRVVRSAGSHGEFDLVASCEEDVLWIQVKANRWRGVLRGEEADAIRAFPVPPVHNRKLAWRVDDNVERHHILEMDADGEWFQNTDLEIRSAIQLRIVRAKDRERKRRDRKLKKARRGGKR